MALRLRRVLHVGPLAWNFTRRGLSSWSVRIGPWSWNSRSRRQRVDLLGPWSWEQDRR